MRFLTHRGDQAAGDPLAPASGGVSDLVNPSRRRWLSAAGASSLAALTAMPTHWMPSARAADAPRKLVLVGGQRAKVIDIHAHCIIPEVGRLLTGTALAGAHLPRPLTASAESLTIGAERLREMDRRGIDLAVLSINQYWWYAADRALAESVVRLHDEGLKAVCDAHPGRFVALTSVALQFPELAAQQLEHAVTKLGLRGASIGGHVNNVVPHDRQYDPFWRKAEELGVPVFVHPGGAENVLQQRALNGAGALSNVIGNPLETTIFISRLIFEGTLDRFPKLKLCLSHGGGYVPSYLGRTEVACEYRSTARCLNKRKPSEYLRDQVLVDSMVFSEEGIRHLVAECGAEQVVYGSDLPFEWPDTIDLIVQSKSLSDAQKRAILGGNLTRLLKIAG